VDLLPTQEVRRLRHGYASIREHCVQASRDPLFCSADRQRYPDVSGFRTFDCRVYTHVNREIGTLDARGEEMRYLGCSSHDSHFHHLYRAHDRRVFATDDVTFVEMDIQLPDHSANMEIELAGLQRLTEDE
jgi:hypothetical protein